MKISEVYRLEKMAFMLADIFPIQSVCIVRLSSFPKNDVNSKVISGSSHWSFMYHGRAQVRQIQNHELIPVLKSLDSSLGDGSPTCRGKNGPDMFWTKGRLVSDMVVSWIWKPGTVSDTVFSPSNRFFFPAVSLLPKAGKCCDPFTLSINGWFGASASMVASYLIS